MHKRRTTPLQFISQIVRANLGVFLAGLIPLFIIQPFLKPGFPSTADTPIHFYRTMEFAASWEPGVIYPRWAPNLAYGYGYPLWDFAPPLPYIIPLIFRALGFSLENSLKGLVILAALGYAVGAYLFIRDHLGAKAGLVGAAIYALAPFALREALLYGGNYPQYLAIGLYPWLLWALGQLVLPRTPDTSSRLWPGILLAAALYGAVMLSHLFHILILTPLAAAYIFLLWITGRRELRRLGATILAFGLGLLWTFFFWAPAFVERNFTRATADVYLSVSHLGSRFLNWEELLAWPQSLDAQSANPWVPFSLGIAPLLLSVLGLLTLLRPRRMGQSEAISWQILFFFGLLLATLFMLLPYSSPIWTGVPLLSVAEFPWRMMGLANLSLAFLGGASLRWVSHLSNRGQTIVVGLCILMVWLSSAVYLYPAHPFSQHGDSLADMTRYELSTRTIGTTTLGEYLPLWVKRVPITSPVADDLTQGRPFEKLDRAGLPDGTTAQLLNRTAVTDYYRFEGAQSFQARFFTYYFPGWKAILNGQPVEVDIEAESGLVSVTIPGGIHELKLQFVDTTLRTVTNTISGLTLGAMAVIGLWTMARGIRRRPVNQIPLQQPASKAKVDWTARSTLMIGGGLIFLFLLKVLIIDPHTTWFRRQSPPGQVLGMQHQLNADLDDRFRLLGYDLNRKTIKPGDTLRVVLYWQAQQPADIDYRSFAHLDSPIDQRTWAGSDNFHPGDATAQIDIPTSTWDTDHYIRDEHIIHLPPTIPPVHFNLRAGLYDPTTGARLPVVGQAEDSIILQSMQISPGKGPVHIPNPTDYRLGKHIKLLGFDRETRPDTLRLYWDTDQPLSTDYIVFVHLLNEQGELVRGFDAPPLNGLYPTSTWHPDTVVVDPYLLSLADLSPGNYMLAVGMYNPATITRLAVVNANGDAIQNDLILLTNLTINNE